MDTHEETVRPISHNGFPISWNYKLYELNSSNFTENLTVSTKNGQVHVLMMIPKQLRQKSYSGLNNWK